MMSFCFLYFYSDHRDQHVLTHAVPTLLSSVLHGVDEEGAVGGTHAVVQAARHVEHRFRHVEMAVGQAAALPQRSQPELTGVMDQPLGIGERYPCHPCQRMFAKIEIAAGPGEKQQAGKIGRETCRERVCPYV